MATPVGPAPRDPADPDLWEEWYESGQDDAPAPRHFGWAIRLVALVCALGIAGLVVFAR